MQSENIRELLKDERFLNYCFKKNVRDIKYWEEWLESNPAQQAEVEELKKLVLLLGSRVSVIEAEDQFARLNHRISEKNTFGISKWLNAYIRYAVAASLVLILGAGLYFLNKIKQSESGLTRSVVYDVPPGSNRATLTLANGAKINLNNAANGAIASESGVKIIKTTNGQLIYDLSGAKNENDEVGYNTIEVPAGGQWQVVLPDQSKVWLNAQSSITYPSRFAGKERKIKITGEAYFEVSHNKDMPFRVESGTQLVEVLGTHFNISAYADDKAISTTLFQGSVKVNLQGKTQMLKPGEQALVKAGKMELVKDVDLEEVLAWKNGDFQFNESLESIMAKIARWYNIEVVYQTKQAAELTFSGKISKSRNISAILKMLEYNGDVHFKVEGRRVTVTD
jgi:transmembrane sensor